MYYAWESVAFNRLYSLGGCLNIFPNMFPIGILFHNKRRFDLFEPPFLLFDFDFFLHIDFLSVRIIEHVLKKSEFLIRNDLDTESVFHLPFTF